VEMHQVRYFVALCEHGSFARAAEASEVSQPALTAAIKRLEQELGGPLFHREGRRLTLSRLGRMVRPHIEQLHGQSHAAARIAEQFRLLKEAPLSVGVMPTVGPARIAGFLGRFRRDHPSVEVAVSTAPLAALLKQLDSGDLDFALVSASETLPDNIRAEPAYSERYVVVFPAGHRFGHMAAVSLADVSGEHYVDRLACEMREAVMALCSARGVELYAGYRSEREDWIEAMVAAGLGFAFMPEYSVASASVLSRPLVDPQVERKLVLADVRGRRRTPVAQAFARALAAHRWDG
jgi:DNA-binding transcriptional LysR family regulator